MSLWFWSHTEIFFILRLVPYPGIPCVWLLVASMGKNAIKMHILLNVADRFLMSCSYIFSWLFEFEEKIADSRIVLWMLVNMALSDGITCFLSELWPLHLVPDALRWLWGWSGRFIPADGRHGISSTLTEIYNEYYDKQAHQMHSPFRSGADTALYAHLSRKRAICGQATFFAKSCTMVATQEDTFLPPTTSLHGVI